jgi:hypothetical protein
VYFGTPKKINMVIQKKMHGMLSYGVVLHDNARPHTAVRTGTLLDYFNWELFDHSPYSPDLAPSDYHLLTYLKNWLRSQRFNNNEELMEGIKTWLCFDTGLQKFIPRYKGLSSGGDYLEK